ncbi:phosphopantetheine-binding protein [Hymenobacter sp.]|uniref:phosphopantetheine-binding protein n=1 Tax=Hymenobacter sp. TaxID=1898978 RepID=UPI002EDB0466
MAHPAPHLAADDDLSLLRFTEDLGMASLDFVELIVSMKTHYRIQIPDSGLQEVHTVQDFVVCLKKNRQISWLNLNFYFQ